MTVLLEQLNNRCDQDTTVSCATNADCSLPGGACGFAGYRDWRLPTLKELSSLVDYGVPAPGPMVGAAFAGASCASLCTDLSDPACSCTNDSLHWTSTTVAIAPRQAWTVSFSSGLFVEQYKHFRYPARAVRGGT